MAMTHARFEAALLRKMKLIIDIGLITREEALDVANELEAQAQAVASAAVKEWLVANGEDALKTIICDLVEANVVDRDEEMRGDGDE
jgi:hypothetical protein